MKYFTLSEPFIIIKVSFFINKCWLGPNSGIKKKKAPFFLSQYLFITQTAKFLQSFFLFHCLVHNRMLTIINKKSDVEIVER